MSNIFTIMPTETQTKAIERESIDESAEELASSPILTSNSTSEAWKAHSLLMATIVEALAVSREIEFSTKQYMISGDNFSLTEVPMLSEFDSHHLKSLSIQLGKIIDQIHKVHKVYRPYIFCRQGNDSGINSIEELVQLSGLEFPVP